MSPADCEVPDFYNETQPIARKAHRCCECRGVIRIGEKYARCVGGYDGSVFSEAQHVACRDFAAEVNKKYSGSDGCFIAFGEVNNEIANTSDWCDDEAEAIVLRQRWAMIRAAGRGELFG